MTHFEPDFLEVYIKNGIEMPEDQWCAELRADYFEDHGCYPNEEESEYIGRDKPYISKSGNTYNYEIYYSGKTISELIDCILEDGYPNAMIDLLESVKKILIISCTAYWLALKCIGQGLHGK